MDLLTHLFSKWGSGTPKGPCGSSGGPMKIGACRSFFKTIMIFLDILKLHLMEPKCFQMEVKSENHRHTVYEWNGIDMLQTKDYGLSLMAYKCSDKLKCTIISVFYILCKDGSLVLCDIWCLTRADFRLDCNCGGGLSVTAIQWPWLLLALTVVG